MMRKHTTEAVIKLATNQLTDDINSLSTQRDNALSMFRQTAVQLNTINDGLRTKLDNLSELEVFIQSQKNNADKMISDNEAVRQRILEIIGE